MALNEYTGGTAPATAQNEPGAEDNRMTLNPNDPQWQKCVDKWEDGKTYKFKEVVVRQESPGQFTVVSADPCESEDGAETDEEGGKEEPGQEGSMGMAGEDMMGGKGDSVGYTNPAVARMMAREKS